MPFWASRNFTVYVFYFTLCFILCILYCINILCVGHALVVYPCTGHSVQLFDHLVVIALYYFVLWSDKLNK